MPPTVDEIIAQRKRYLNGLPGAHFDESPVTEVNFDLLIAEIERLRAEVEAYQKDKKEYVGKFAELLKTQAPLLIEIERLREDKKRLDELASCPQCKLCFVPPDEPLKTKPIFDHRGRHIGYRLIDELRWCDIRCPSCSTITERRPGESR